MSIGPSASAAAGVLLGLAASLVLAQGASGSREETQAAGAYPNRSIRLVVDTSPGGLTDLLARMSAEGLARKFGHSVVVENKPGASGNVAADFLVRSPADGYSLMIAAGGNLVVKPFLERSLPFDPIKDLAPVFNIAEASHILVVPAALQARDLAQFIAFAKANPGKVYYGSDRLGKPPHLSVELFAPPARPQLLAVAHQSNRHEPSAMVAPCLAM